VARAFARDGGGMRNGEKKSRKFAKGLRARMTDAEVILWSFLRQHPKYRFRRQHPVGPYIADSPAPRRGSLSRSTVQRTARMTRSHTTADANLIWSAVVGVWSV